MRSLRIVTAETPKRVARSPTRARPCSSTIRTMCSWRSRAKTSPGEALAGTVTPLLLRSRSVGTDRGFDWLPTHSRRHAERNVKKVIEINRNLWQATPWSGRSLGGAARHVLEPVLTPTRPADAGRHLLRRPRRQPPAGSDTRPAARTIEPTDATGETARRATEADVISNQAVGNQAVVATLRAQRIELPSWAFGNSGTRFKVFAQKGVPRTRTRRSPTRPRSTASPASRRASRSTSRGTGSTTTRTSPATPPTSGSASGTINSNVFQDDDYMLGSVCNPDPRVRRKALDHLLACIDIMDATGSRDLKLWFSDGTNYPGQDDIRARQDRLAEALAAVHARLGPDQRMLLEYKFFEPSFYTMDVPGLGHRLHPVRRGRPEGQGRRRHRPPRAGHEHRVHRRVAAARRTASAGSTSTRASTPTTT